MKYTHQLNIPQMEISLFDLQQVTQILSELDKAIKPKIKTIKHDLNNISKNECTFRLLAVTKVWDFDEEKETALNELLHSYQMTYKVTRHFDIYSGNGYVRIDGDNFSVEIHTNCKQ